MEFGFDLVDPVVVIRLSDTRFALEGVEDEPMGRRHLAILLQALGIDVHEIAFMILYFKENPAHQKAYFGINGTFLYSK